MRIGIGLVLFFLSFSASAQTAIDLREVFKAVAPGLGKPLVVDGNVQGRATPVEGNLVGSTAVAALNERLAPLGYAVVDHEDYFLVQSARNLQRDWHVFAANPKSEPPKSLITWTGVLDSPFKTGEERVLSKLLTRDGELSVFGKKTVIVTDRAENVANVQAQLSSRKK